MDENIRFVQILDDLKEKGVNCDFIYANNDNKDNERKIRAFKNGKLGGI